MDQENPSPPPAQDTASDPVQTEAERRVALPDVARRALEEADARKAKAKSEETSLPIELGGRDGPEPVRYGDWEKKGIAIDF
ncbi:MAG: DUF1674 domain-containing protein [Marinovum sp.]|nr:DUF1674 domain-containing protein [Marinovum sp.]